MAGQKLRTMVTLILCLSDPCAAEPGLSKRLPELSGGSTLDVTTISPNESSHTNQPRPSALLLNNASEIGETLAVTTLKTSEMGSDAGPYQSSKPAVIPIEANRPTKGSDAESDCKALLTRYVYEVNECGNATDVESFTKTENPRHSCLNRCSKRNEPSAQQNCACDPLCLVYKDCCSDFERVCVENYHRGQVSLPHLIRAEPVCVNVDVGLSTALITLEPGAASFGPTTFSTTTLQFSPDFAMRRMRQYFSSWPLRGFFGSTKEFLVADLTFRVLFGNFASFLHYTYMLQSTYLFVPKIAILFCSFHSISGDSPISLAWHMDRCSPNSVVSATSQLRRSCYRPASVFCRCTPGEIFSERVGTACQGNWSTEPPLSHAGPPYTSVIPYKHIVDERIQCTVQDYGTGSDNANTVKQTDGFTLKTISFTPLLVSAGLADGVERASLVEELGLEQASEGENAPVGLLAGKAIEYIVETRDALERRLRCPSLKSFLSDCQLVECAPGAFITSSSQSPWKFSGQVCFLPVKAAAAIPGVDLQLPACTCFRIQDSLLRLGIWSSKLKQQQERVAGDCRLSLDIPQKKIRPKHDRYQVPEEAYDQYHSVFYAERAPPSEQFPQERLQELLYETEDYCAEETFSHLQICFYAEEVYQRERGDSGNGGDALCITLKARRLTYQQQERNTGSSLLTLSTAAPVWYGLLALRVVSFLFQDSIPPRTFGVGPPA